MEEYKDPKYKPAEAEFEALFKKPNSRKNWVEVHCPRCNDVVSADHINLEKSVAKCGSCHALFSVADVIDTLQQQQSPEEIDETKEKMEVIHFPNGIDIDLKPIFGENYGGLAIIYGILAIMMLIIFLAVMIGSSMKLFPTLMAGICFLLLSWPFPYIYAKYKNRLRFYIDKHQFEFEQHPFRLPFMRKSFNGYTDQVEKIYTKKYKRWDTAKEVYELVVRQYNGEDKVLIRDLKDVNQVRFLVEEINGYLARREP